MNKVDSENEDSKPTLEQLINEDGEIWHRKDFYFNINNDVDHSPSTTVSHKLEHEHEPSEDDTNKEVPMSVDEGTKEEILHFVDERIYKIEHSKDPSCLNDYIDIDHPSRSRIKSECEYVPSGDDSDVEEIQVSDEEETKDEVFQLIDGRTGKIWNRTGPGDLENSIKKETRDGMFHEKERATPKICFESSPLEICRKVDVGDVRFLAKPHKCKLCNYSAINKSILTRHIAAIHLKEKPHKCHLCNYSATTKVNLNYHVSGVHLRAEPHKCHLCGYSTNRKDNFKKHIVRVHLKEKLHKCDLCNYSAIHKNELTRHITGVHLKEKPHKCHLCNFSTTHKSELTRHIASVHLKEKPHKCHLCNYSAIYKSRLKHHITGVHLKERPYKCYLCDYSATKKGDLKYHIEDIHSEEKFHKYHL